MDYESKIAELFDTIRKNDTVLFRHDMDQIQSYLKLWELELISNKSKTTEKTSLKKYKKLYTELHNDLFWAENKAGRSQETKPVASVSYAETLQNDSSNSLDRSLASIEDSKQVATETAKQLQIQTAQMGNIHDDLYETDDMLTSATKHITSMAKRIASDKVVWVFGFLVVVAIIIAIIL